MTAQKTTKSLLEGVKYCGHKVCPVCSKQLGIGFLGIQAHLRSHKRHKQITEAQYYQYCYDLAPAIVQRVIDKRKAQANA